MEEEFEESNINQLVDTENVSESKSAYEQIIDILGLNININYPLKIIQNGIIELHTINEKPNSNITKYSRCILFRKDPLSRKLENILFGYGIGYMRNQIQIYRSINRLHRNFKYEKIINVVDRKEQKKDTLGFNYDNPRWTPLESIFI